MKYVLPFLLTASLCIMVPAGRIAADEKKDEKSPLPGNATWELKAFNSLFRVVKTEYDDRVKQVKWTVETKEGYRTSDFVRAITAKPFTFRFLDEAMNELALVELFKDDFRGIPDSRVMKEGTRLTIILAVPRAMAKVKTVLLQRGRS
jgi:hypothetical protein